MYIIQCLNCKTCDNCFQLKIIPEFLLMHWCLSYMHKKWKWHTVFWQSASLGCRKKNPNILVNRQWTLESKKNPQASSLEQRVPRTMNLCMKTIENSVISPIPVHSGVTSEATCISYLLSSVWANKSLKKITYVVDSKNKQYHVHGTCETTVQYLAKSHTCMQGFTHWLNPVLTWATVQCHCHILQVFTCWCKKKCELEWIQCETFTSASDISSGGFENNIQCKATYCHW